MKICWLSAAAASLCLLTDVSASIAADDATVLRLFLRDGGSLVSYGEFARVADRVIFSLPTSDTANPPLQLVNLSADRIDWDRTNRYADTARAARYTATQGENDYVALSNAVSKSLDEVAYAPDSARRLAIVENARQMLADWPRSHFNYRLADVRQMLTLLDEAIADLRASSEGTRFALSLVAVTEPPASNEPLLPPPTAIESIDGMLLAARLAESPDERESLLGATIAVLERDAAKLPHEWATSVRAKTTAALESEQGVDRSYQNLIRKATSDASARARAGDVRGIQRVLVRLRRSDAVLGRQRADAVDAALAAVAGQLDAARRLRLARERWQLRAPALRRYRASIAPALSSLTAVAPTLGDIKDLSGSSRAALAKVQREAAHALKVMQHVAAPEEGLAAHALLVSATHLARSAARIRAEAMKSGDIARAWDASAAAAGALMLSARAKADIQAFLRRPELK